MGIGVGGAARHRHPRRALRLELRQAWRLAGPRPRRVVRLAAACLAAGIVVVTRDLRRGVFRFAVIAVVVAIVVVVVVILLLTPTVLAVVTVVDALQPRGGRGAGVTPAA